MNNPRLSQRYAKSLLDLSKEMNKLEDVYKDVLFLQQVVQGSREFVTMLNSPVINADKKISVINAVTKGRVTEITTAFLKLLCNKNREDNLPGVINSFIKQYNTLKGIHSATLTTAVPVSDAIKDDFKARIRNTANIEHLHLETKVNENLIGGFVLEMEGKLIDASILKDLNDVKKQFDNNEYLHKLR